MAMHSRIHRSLAGLAGALALGALLAGPAAAATSTASVTQQINGGSLTATLTSGSMTTVSYSNTSQNTTGSLHLEVNDATGSGQGWNVQISSTAFVYGGTSTYGQNIGAANFSIATAHDPSLVSGEAINATNGPLAVGGGSLDSARKTISAQPGYGSGIYGQDLDLALNVPAQSQAGSYTATLTVAVVAGP